LVLWDYALVPVENKLFVLFRLKDTEIAAQYEPGIWHRFAPPGGVHARAAA
jgi:hypothetical protein